MPGKTPSRKQGMEGALVGYDALNVYGIYNIYYLNIVARLSFKCMGKYSIHGAYFVVDYENTFPEVSLT